MAKRDDFSFDLSGALRQRSLERLDQYAFEIQGHCVIASKNERARDEAYERLRDLQEINSTLVVADAGKIAGFMLALTATIAAFLLDFVMLGAVSEYFADRVYESDSMKLATRVLIPAAVIWLEMLISTQCCFASQSLSFSRSRSRWGWILLGIAVGVVVPAMLIATSIAAHPDTADSSIESVFTWQTIGLVGLSVAVHGAVLYGGALALEAKAWAIFLLRQARLRKRVAGFDDRYEAAAVAATNYYHVYLRELRLYNAQVSAELRIPQGPFDKLTVSLLMKRTGVVGDDSQPSPLLGLPAHADSD